MALLGVDDVGADEEVATLNALRHFGARELQYRRHQVDALHPVAHDGSAPTALRQLHEERHVQDLSVQRVAVCEPSVIEELFAVIGGQHDQRIVE